MLDRVSEKQFLFSEAASRTNPTTLDHFATRLAYLIFQFL
jgi:hypothetical protein